MSLHWDRFDNALTELWKFFGPPILNFMVLMFVFGEVLRTVFLRMAQLISSTYPALLDRLVALTSSQQTENGTAGATNASTAAVTNAAPADPVSNVSDLSPEQITKLANDIISGLDLLLDNAGATVFYVLIVLAIVIFLLDVVTRIIGNLVPITMSTDDLRLVNHTLLDPSFGAVENAESPDRYNAWLRAKTELDSMPEMSEYRSRRDSLKTDISARHKLVSYLNAYGFVLLPMTILVSWLVPGSSAGLIDLARKFLWIVPAGVFLLAVFSYQRARLFVLCIDLVRNDMEAFNALKKQAMDRTPNSPSDSFDLKDRNLRAEAQSWQECVPVTVMADSLLVRFPPDSVAGRIFLHGSSHVHCALKHLGEWFAKQRR